ncbi:uncharacterized protein LOC132700092 [Cylas formicarius]|uniref:uncharacterized protein LOC132700092 n=1 Tax=Cylas formicarius TaxID=197179 RepID=UPI002958657D|nr:uncharacterized protein LOC132700092 [Cylas formicarius]
MTAKGTTVISLPQMVDLALNSPEVGVVNFTVLHSLLHVIVNQLDLGDCNVEFRGSDSERLQNYISTAKPGPVITLTEYTIGPDGKGRRKRRGSKKKEGKRTSIATDDNQKEKEITIIRKDESLMEDVASSDSFQTIVVVEPASKDKIADPPKFTIALTREHLCKLQADIKTLQQQVQELIELPANIGLIEALRADSADKASPVLDMFQILNLAKRLDAMEVAMSKMASMIEYLAREQDGAQRVEFKPIETILPAPVTLKEPSSIRQQRSTDVAAIAATPQQSLIMPSSGSDYVGRIASLENRVTTLERTVRALQLGTTSTNPKVANKKSVNLPAATESGSGKSGDKPNTQRDEVGEKQTTLPNPEKNVQKGEESSKGENPRGNPKENAENPKKEEPAVAESPQTTNPKENTGNPKEEKPAASEYPQGSNQNKHDELESTQLVGVTSNEAHEILRNEINELRELCADRDTVAFVIQEINELKDALLHGKGLETVPPEILVTQIDLRMNELSNRVNVLEGARGQQLDNVRHLVADVDELRKKITELSELAAKDHSDKIADLDVRIGRLQDDLATVSDAAQKMIVERESQQDTYDMMREQIELLKTVKADREDLEDALADKADACQINRKVSHEQFDAAWNELSQALEDNIEKLRRQEEIWTQSLNEVQLEIGNKLDKVDLVPLKDFINDKLKAVQEKVKKMSSMKREHEAAGAKSKYLRNVNCISCDADVVMRKQTDVTMFPRPYSMPPSKNAGPYLAYELDQLRKQQKTLPIGKNVNMFERAILSAKNTHLSADHICNRYCGGSHTITTPEQRVMRTGHFLEQWGPEIAPVKDTLIRGTDGHLYKSRDDEALRAVAAEKGPAVALEEPSSVVVDKYRPAKEKTQGNGKNGRPKTSLYNGRDDDALTVVAAKEPSSVVVDKYRPRKKKRRTID